jgi:hypothetical protein
MAHPLVYITHKDVKSDDPGGPVSRRHFEQHLAEKGWQVVSPVTGKPVPSLEAVTKLTGDKADALLREERLERSGDTKIAGTLDDKRARLAAHYGYAAPPAADAGTQAGTTTAPTTGS